MGVFESKVGSPPSSGRTLYTNHSGPDLCCNRTKTKYRWESGGDCVKRTTRSGPSRDCDEMCGSCSRK